MACAVMPGAEHLTGLYVPWANPYDTHSSYPEAPSQTPQSRSQPAAASTSETGIHRERGSSYHHISDLLRSYLPSHSPFRGHSTSAGSSPRKGGHSLLPSSRKLPSAFGKGLVPARLTVELRKALDALDMAKDGRVESSDVEAVLGMAFGVDASTGGQSWEDLKASCECADGRLKLASVQSALTTGALFAEVEKMQPLSTSASATQSSSGRAGAGVEEAWRLETKGGLGPFRGLCHCIAVFKKFDDDQNGLVDARDLQLALKRLTGKAYSKAECKMFIQKVDGNYNNVVELSEFVTLVQMLKCEGVICKQNLI